MFPHYCIQNVKDGIQIRVYKINKESVTHCSQFISVKVKKILRKSQARFQEKLKKLRLRINDGFLIKKTCTTPRLSGRFTLVPWLQFPYMPPMMFRLFLLFMTGNKKPSGKFESNQH